MGGASPWLWLADALGVAALCLLRFAWSLPKRSVSLNASAWAALAVAVVIAWYAEGAWGAAIVGLVTIAASFLALGIAGATAPAGRASVSNRLAGMLPQGNEPRRIGRRIGTFLLVIAGGLLASIGLAVAVRGMGGALGWNEANAFVLALFTVPIAWAILASVMLMQTSRRNQIVTLLVCCLPAVPPLLTGVIS